jgi:hypothetical protein
MVNLWYIKVQRSIPMNDGGCDEEWDVDQIFITYITNLGEVGLGSHNWWPT